MKPFELGKANLDQRLDRLLEARLPRDRKRLLVALTRLGRADALLEAVVSGHEQLLNSLARVFRFHGRSLTGRSFV